MTSFTIRGKQPRIEATVSENTEEQIKKYIQNQQVE